MPENQQNEEILTAAQEIRDYLMAHPNAADSAQGIAKWWLGRRRYEEAIETVRSALDYLVAEGTVIKRKMVSGETVYVRGESKSGSNH